MGDLGNVKREEIDREREVREASLRREREESMRREESLRREREESLRRGSASEERKGPVEGVKDRQGASASPALANLLH